MYARMRLYTIHKDSSPKHCPPMMLATLSALPFSSATTTSAAVQVAFSSSPFHEKREIELVTNKSGSIPKPDFLVRLVTRQETRGGRS